MHPPKGFFFCFPIFQFSASLPWLPAHGFFIWLVEASPNAPSSPPQPSIGFQTGENYVQSMSAQQFAVRILRRLDVLFKWKLQTFSLGLCTP